MEAFDSSVAPVSASRAQPVLSALAQRIKNAGGQGSHMVLQGKASREIAGRPVLMVP